MKYDPLLHVVLHQPEIPYNTGSVGRTCVAVGAKLWLVRPLGFRIDDYYLRRAGLDYWEHLEWQVADDWADLVAGLSSEQVAKPESRDPIANADAIAGVAMRAWYFSKTAEREYTDIAFAQGDALVFGCETQGLPRSMLEEQADRALRIPTRSEVRSLNLSNAVAVVVYEALRQWRAREIASGF